MPADQSHRGVQHSVDTLAGVLLSLTAYLIWGLSPIYFKFLTHVPAMEILAHRMLWSLILLVPIILFTRQWGAFVRALTTRRTLLLLAGTGVIVAVNMLLYIWAINHNIILQTSLGYFINPLVTVGLGALVLRERLRPLQTTAVAIAAGGVLYLTIQYGEFPWLALGLALTFGSYGMLRKIAPVDALVGLATELLIMLLPVLGYLLHLDNRGDGLFLRFNWQNDLTLMGSALVTGLPLMLFTLGIRRLRLTTTGFIQYLVPTCTFLLAVFVYREPLVRSQLWCFIAIWTALGLFSYDSLQVHRGRERDPL